MAILLENNVSRWFDVDAVPEGYTFSQEFRPGTISLNENKRNTFSIIDLSKVSRSSTDKEEVIKQILTACQESGVFQVINHGFSGELIEETFSILKEFFSMPVEDKAYKGNGSGWVYLNSTDYDRDGVHLWRENVKLPCHPLEDCMKSWPEKPSRYREVVASYLLAIERLGSRILELLCEGLGLKAEYLKNISEVQLLSANNYPACPDPSLTLGLLKHKDPSFITLLYQGNISGLQVLQNDEWVTVDALQNAFVVNIGNQLEIISNGKLRSPEHRVVTNSQKSRTSIATFINPSPSCIVKPATDLIDELNPPLFKPTMYKDFVYGTQAFGLLTESLTK